MSESLKDSIHSEHNEKTSSDSENEISRKTEDSRRIGPEELQKLHEERGKAIGNVYSSVLEINRNHEIEGNALRFISKYSPRIAGTDVEGYLNPYFSAAAASGQYYLSSLESLQRDIEAVSLKSAYSTGTTQVIATTLADSVTRNPNLVGGTANLRSVHAEYGEIDPTPQQERLDKWLSKYDPQLVERRKQAWKDFHIGKPENLVNAAHQMRGILEWLLDNFARPEDVEKAEWFDPAKHQINGKVRKLAKVLYFIHGPAYSKRWDLDLASLDSLAEDIKKRHDELVKKAHWSHSDRERVKYLVREYEQLLEQMFTLREML